MRYEIENIQTAAIPTGFLKAPFPTALATKKQYPTKKKKEKQKDARREPVALPYKIDKRRQVRKKRRFIVEKISVWQRPVGNQLSVLEIQGVVVTPNAAKKNQRNRKKRHRHEAKSPFW